MASSRVKSLFLPASAFENLSIGPLGKAEGGLFRHTVHKVKYKLDGTIFYQKELKSDSTQAIEYCAGELFHLLIPHQPRVLQSINRDGVRCINSEEMPHDRPMEGERRGVLQRDLESGKLQGLGAVFAVGYFLNESDWKDGNLRITTINGQHYVVKIDNDWCFSSIKDLNYVGDGVRSNEISASGAMNIPLMDDYMDFNRLDCVVMGKNCNRYLPNSTEFCLIRHELLSQKFFQEEIYQAYLKILLLPPELMMIVAQKSSEDSHLQQQLVEELFCRQKQLFVAMLTNPFFETYLASNQAKAVIENSIQEYQDYCDKNHGKIKLDPLLLRAPLDQIKAGFGEKVQDYLDKAKELDAKIRVLAPKSPLEHLLLLVQKQRELAKLYHEAKAKNLVPDQGILKSINIGLENEITKVFRRALYKAKTLDLVNDEGYLALDNINEQLRLYHELQQVIKGPDHNNDLSLIRQIVTDKLVKAKTLEAEVGINKSMTPFNPNLQQYQILTKTTQHYELLRALLEKLPLEDRDDRKRCLAKMKELKERVASSMPTLIKELKDYQALYSQEKNAEGLSVLLGWISPTLIWLKSTGVDTGELQKQRVLLKASHQGMLALRRLEDINVKLKTIDEKVDPDDDQGKILKIEKWTELSSQYDILKGMAKVENNPTLLLDYEREVEALDLKIKEAIQALLDSMMFQALLNDDGYTIENFAKRAPKVALINRLIALVGSNPKWVEGQALTKFMNNELKYLRATAVTLVAESKGEEGLSIESLFDKLAMRVRSACPLRIAATSMTDEALNNTLSVRREIFNYIQTLCGQGDSAAFSAAIKQLGQLELELINGKWGGRDLSLEKDINAASLYLSHYDIHRQTEQELGQAASQEMDKDLLLDKELKCYVKLLNASAAMIEATDQLQFNGMLQQASRRYDQDEQGLSLALEQYLSRSLKDFIHKENPQPLDFFNFYCRQLEISENALKLLDIHPQHALRSYIEIKIHEAGVSVNAAVVSIVSQFGLSSHYTPENSSNTRAYHSKLTTQLKVLDQLLKSLEGVNLPVVRAQLSSFRSNTSELIAQLEAKHMRELKGGGIQTNKENVSPKNGAPPRSLK